MIRGICKISGCCGWHSAARLRVACSRDRVGTNVDDDDPDAPLIASRQTHAESSEAHAQADALLSRAERAVAHALEQAAPPDLPASVSLPVARQLAVLKLMRAELALAAAAHERLMADREAAELRGVGTPSASKAQDDPNFQPAVVRKWLKETQSNRAMPTEDELLATPQATALDLCGEAHALLRPAVAAGAVAVSRLRALADSMAVCSACAVANKGGGESAFDAAWSPPREALQRGASAVSLASSAKGRRRAVLVSERRAGATREREGEGCSRVSLVVAAALRASSDRQSIDGGLIPSRRRARSARPSNCKSSGAYG